MPEDGADRLTAGREALRRQALGRGLRTGPIEAAHVINNLVTPASVIVSHANEPATEGGKLKPNTKTATFKQATKVPVHLPLSGKTLEFDGAGKCVAGC